MSRHFMRLAYRGAPFNGWQVQPGATVTVQGELERALGLLLRAGAPVAVTGAGRTDAGVNARAMVAHFDTDIPFDGARLAARLNAFLGPDIAVRDIWPVPDDAHARFSALSRTYRYYVTTQKDPFTASTGLAWQARHPLDFNAMNEAAALLLGRHDFTSFSKLHTQVANNLCTVTGARWSQSPGNPALWWFEITANRFLRNMVRAVVGTLVEVGRGKLPAAGFARVVESRDRCAAGESMPGHALFLWDVAYSSDLTSGTSAF